MTFLICGHMYGNELVTGNGFWYFGHLPLTPSYTGSLEIWQAEPVGSRAHAARGPGLTKTGFSSLLPPAGSTSRTRAL